MLDTDICSCVMKRSSQPLLKKLSEVAVTEVGMSVVTKAELLYGVQVSPHPARDGEALKALLTYVAVLDFQEVAAEHYAQIRADLRRRGRVIGANDLLIASHARSLGVTLITNNTAEFSWVEGLSLGDWGA